MPQARNAPSKLAFLSPGARSRSEGGALSWRLFNYLHVGRHSLSIQEEAGGGEGRLGGSKLPTPLSVEYEVQWFGGGLATRPERRVQCASYSSRAREHTHRRSCHGAHVTRVAADGGRPWDEMALSYPTTFAQTRGAGGRRGRRSFSSTPSVFSPFQPASIAKWQLAVRRHAQVRWFPMYWHFQVVCALATDKGDSSVVGILL